MKTLPRYLAPALLAMMCCPAGAGTEEEETNKRLARRIYDEGLSRGNYAGVPYTPDFVGHGSRGRTFTHEAGMAEARAVAEEWVSADSLSLMRQLGLLPPPATPPAGAAAAAGPGAANPASAEPGIASQ